MSEIKPAMTAEEWAKGLREVIDGHVDLGLGSIDVRLGEYGEQADADRQAQALAALLLHGQPFGFTWDDVDKLRIAAADYESALWPIADRIAALLPPRE